MKLKLISFAFMLMMTTFAYADEFSLSVHIKGVKNNQGNVFVELYNDAKTFRKSAQAFAILQVPATEGIVTVKFDGVKPGHYAVLAYHDEDGNGFTATQLASTAHAVETGWSLAGSKRLVADAPHADILIVSARIAGAAGDDAIALFLLPVATPGLRLHAMTGFDRRRLGDVRFDGLLLPPEALLVAPGEAVAAIRRALGRSVCALAAEASGLCGWLTQATREYLTGRRQFGVALVSFQVLQHRLVEMQIALEELRTAVRIAAISCEAGEPDGVLVSAAKVKVARAGRFIGYQAIQLFGGMGMTDEMPVGDYAKRLEAIALLAGGVDVHLDRIVAAGGVTG